MNEHQYPASLTHGLSRKEILNRLRNRLDQPRYEHCLRVEATAIELAKRFDQDVAWRAYCMIMVKKSRLKHINA